jgi:hypothetical protein
MQKYVKKKKKKKKKDVENRGSIDGRAIRHEDEASPGLRSK